MDYCFFSYKYNISGFESALFSTPHFVYICLAFLSVILLGYFLRKVDHKKFRIFMLVVAIVLLVLEIVKVSWESYYDITTGRGFNAMGILPIYTCSLLTYTSFVAVFAKGKTREAALAWIGTIGLICGCIGVIYTNALNWYPFWTFGAFHSLTYHYMLLLMGVLVLSTGCIKLEWRHVFLSWIPILLLSIIASPVNYCYGGDYMSTYSGDGVPLMHDLANTLAGYNLRPIYTFIMIAAYLLISLIVVSVYKLIVFIYRKIKQNKQDQTIKIQPSQ